MSTADKNLSEASFSSAPTDISALRFALIVAQWNTAITEKLFEGAKNTLLAYGASAKNVLRVNVPGSYELTLATQWMAQREDVDAIIALGAVIQGETKHNDYINYAVSLGLTQVSLKYDKPVIFGVLTPNNMEQAQDRAGGKYGNKGDEAAITAIKMLGLKISEATLRDKTSS